MPELAKINRVADALKVAKRISDPLYSNMAFLSIAVAQNKAGDRAAYRAALLRAESALSKNDGLQMAILETYAAAGDIEGLSKFYKKTLKEKEYDYRLVEIACKAGH